MSRKKSVAVIVEGKEFESMQAAATFIGTKSVNIWRAAHTNHEYNGLSVYLKNPEDSQAKSLSSSYAKEYYHKKKHLKDNAVIRCENLNKTFKTIADAAKFANTSSYTISTKTETAGRFIDKAGNIYTRLKPMRQRTSKVYPNTGEEIQVERPSGYKRNETHRNITVESKPTVMEVNPVSVLQNEAINHIQNGDYIKAEMFIAALKLIANKQ